ncbi:MAG: TolC family protein [Pseudomonadota bacterium]
MASLAACAAYHDRPLASGPDLAPSAARLRVDVSQLRLAPLNARRFDPSDGLDPGEAAVLAVLNSPDLAAKRAIAHVAAAQAFSAGLLPDPQLALSLDVPVPAGFTNAYNIAPSLDLIGLITRSAALRAARASAGQADLDLLWSEWSAAQQARGLAVSILGGEAKARVLAEVDQGLEARSRQSDLAFRRGDVAAAQASADRAAELDARAQLAAARAAAAKARGDLNALIGLAPGVVLPLVPGAPGAEPGAPALEAALASLPRRRPDLLALKAGYGAQDANLRRAILTQFPVVNLGFSHQSDTSGVVTNGPTATFTIPIFNRGRGEIAIQSATRERLAAEYQARLDQSAADVAAARRERDAARAVLARLEARVPALVAMAGQARTALGRGDIDSAAFLALDQAALRARVSLLDQRLALDLADVGLDTVLFLPSEEEASHGP